MRLSIRDLTKEYDKIAILSSAGYTFEEGMIYGIVGPKGSGKTTLVDCISGESDYKGSIGLEMNGDVVLPGIENVSVSFQHPMVPDFLTGYEYIRFFLDTHRDKKTAGYSVEQFLQLLNIPKNMWGMMIRDYSLDFKNRLQLVGLFITGSPVIILDEPVGDTPQKEWKHIKKLLDAFKLGHIVIIATESPKVAAAFCDEVVLLKNGKFVPLAHRDLIRTESFEEPVDEETDIVFEEWTEGDE